MLYLDTSPNKFGQLEVYVMKDNKYSKRHIIICLISGGILATSAIGASYLYREFYQGYGQASNRREIVKNHKREMNRDIWTREFTIIEDVEKLEKSIHAVMEVRSRLEKFCEKESRYPNRKEMKKIFSTTKSDMMDDEGRLFQARVKKRADASIVMDIYTFGIDGKVEGSGSNEDIAFRFEGKLLENSSCLSSLENSLFQELKGKDANERKGLYLKILDDLSDRNREERRWNF